MRPRIFLSHNRADNEIVTAIYEALNNAGHRPALDLKNLKAGDRWRSKVHAWMDSCDVGVFVLSTAALESSWVRHELESLSERRRRHEKQDWPRLVIALHGVDDTRVRAVYDPIELNQNQFVVCPPGGGEPALISGITDAVAAIEFQRRPEESRRYRMLVNELDEAVVVPPELEQDDEEQQDWRDEIGGSEPKHVLARQFRQRTPGQVAGFLANSDLARHSDGRRRRLSSLAGQAVLDVVTVCALVDEETMRRFERCWTIPENAEDPEDAAAATRTIGVIVSNEDLTARTCFRESELFRNRRGTELKVVAKPVEAPDHALSDHLARAIAREISPDSEDVPDDELIQTANKWIRNKWLVGIPTAVLLHAAGGLSDEHVDHVLDVFPKLAVLISSGEDLEAVRRWGARADVRSIPVVADIDDDVVEFLALERAVKEQYDAGRSALQELAAEERT